MGEGLRVPLIVRGDAVDSAQDGSLRDLAREHARRYIFEEVCFVDDHHGRVRHARLAETQTGHQQRLVADDQVRALGALVGAVEKAVGGGVRTAVASRESLPPRLFALRQLQLFAIAVGSCFRPDDDLG